MAQLSHSLLYFLIIRLLLDISFLLTIRSYNLFSTFVIGWGCYWILVKLCHFFIDKCIQSRFLQKIWGMLLLIVSTSRQQKHIGAFTQGRGKDVSRSLPANSKLYPANNNYSSSPNPYYHFCSTLIWKDSYIFMKGH